VDRFRFGRRGGCEACPRTRPAREPRRPPEPYPRVFRAEAEDVRVLGVDDFGFRKGSAPGTILVDLERHKVADLFEGHSGESIARWLRRHPGVEVVTRDRSHVCREGINAGAPGALQVADRWHLLRSLALGLEEFLLCASDPCWGGPLRPERAKKGSGCPAPSTRTFRPCPSAWESGLSYSRYLMG
jgi:hypothetical protein